MTGRGLRTATDLVDSSRDPLLAGEVVETVRGHAIPLAALVTGRLPGLLPPLTACNQRRVDGEPHGSLQPCSFETRFPPRGHPFYSTGGGSCALDVLTSSRDGLYLFVSPAGLRIDQDAGGCQRRSCSTYPSSAQDSSETCGC